MKELINNALRKCGYQITRVKRRTEFQRGFNQSYLSRICQPRTVIDVGVGYGTPALYQAYPTAKFVLVEPLRDYEAAINQIARQYECAVYYKGVSNTEGVKEINVDTKHYTCHLFKTGHDSQEQTIHFIRGRFM